MPTKSFLNRSFLKLWGCRSCWWCRIKIKIDMALHCKNENGEKKESEVGDLVAQHLRDLGVTFIMIDHRSAKRASTNTNHLNERAVETYSGQLIPFEDLKTRQWGCPVYVKEEPFVHAKNEITESYCRHDAHLYLPGAQGEPFYNGLWEIKNQNGGGSCKEKIWDTFGGQLVKGYYWTDDAALLLGGDEFEGMSTDLMQKLRENIEDYADVGVSARPENMPSRIDVTNNIENFLDGLFSDWAESEDLSKWKDIENPAPDIHKHNW